MESHPPAGEVVEEEYLGSNCRGEKREDAYQENNRKVSVRNKHIRFSGR